MFNISSKPRTVAQVQELDNAIAKCDKLLDRAVNQGRFEASMKYETKLAELSALMADVSDNLWGKYCAKLLTTTEEGDL